MDIRLYSGQQYQDLQERIRDPFGMLKRLTVPGHYALAAVETVGAEELTLGVLTFAKTGDSMMVEWIWVEQAVRDKGIAHELMMAAFRVADGFGIPELYAYLPFFYGRESVCRGDVNFARRYFGEGGSPVPGEWQRSVQNLTPVIRELKQLFDAREDKNTLSAIEPLRNKGAGITKTLSLLEKAEQVETLYPLAADKKDRLALEVSMVTASEQDPAGGILWQEMGDELLLCAYGAANPGTFQKLLLASLMQIKKDYTPDTVIRIQLWTDAYTDLIRQVFGENSGALLLKGDVKQILVSGPTSGFEPVEVLEDNPAEVLNGYFLEAEEQGRAREVSIGEAKRLYQPPQGTKKSQIKTLRGILLTELSEGLNLVLDKEENRDRGWIKNVPVDYFDQTTSLCKKDPSGRILSMCLTHYEEEEERLYVVGCFEEREKTELLPISLMMAGESYSPNLTVVLPV